MKKIIATVTLMSVLMVSGVFANTTTKTGLLLSDFAGEQTVPCTETKTETKTNWGIIVGGLTGIIVGGFTGIIVGGVSETPVDCGIIVGG